MVMTAMLGCPQAAMAAISPKPDIPISKTAASVFSSILSAVNGMPMVLFRLPSVLSVSYRSDSTAAIISLVVVLPTEPVTATTGQSNCARYPPARSKSACRVSATYSAGMG